jgi:hypothetical protein
VWYFLVILPKIVKRIREWCSVEMYDVSCERRGFWYDVTLCPGAAFITPAKRQLCRNSSSCCCHWFSANGFTIEIFHITQVCKIIKNRSFRIKINWILKSFAISGTAGHCCWLSGWHAHPVGFESYHRKQVNQERTDSNAVCRGDRNSVAYLAVPTTYSPHHFRPDLAFILIKCSS